MATYVLRRYRCAKPVYLYGRILSTGEVIKMPPADAEEYVASGHLRELDEAAVPVNGSAWCQPTTR